MKCGSRMSLSRPGLLLLDRADQESCRCGKRLVSEQIEVPEEGLEPSCPLGPYAFKARLSASSSTPALT